MRNVLTFISGVLLALVILFVAGAGVTRYLIGRLSVPPDRPTFENDRLPSPVASESPTESPATPAAIATPEPPNTPETPSPSPTEAETDGYTARVIQPIGLILRESPTADSRQIAGLEYNTEVIVLEENEDGSWLRVQLPNSGVEGWIKAGNTEKVQ
ncbi:MAG: SH3 domain-containing protein [Synechococcales cyanobacterium T60_A2020_003]|nr:SH3 domain-containing protein [Synechococcales cyanobacterium T60_A2020_003]